MTIPRVVHYCWFGDAPMPMLEQRCLSSWASVLKGYEFRCWDESNVDISATAYMRQAYDRGRYAFVSDVARIQALHAWGGVYLDTDVEILRTLNEFLNANAFLGFENRTNVGTAVIGAMPGNQVLGDILKYYRTHDFVDCRGIEDTTTNVKVLQAILEAEYGFQAVDSKQDLGVVTVWPRAVFAPRRIGDRAWEIVPETAAIHHQSGSWLSERERRRGSSLIWRDYFRPTLRMVRRAVSALLGESRAKQVETRVRQALR